MYSYTGFFHLEDHLIIEPTRLTIFFNPYINTTEMLFHCIVEGLTETKMSKEKHFENKHIENQNITG